MLDKVPYLGGQPLQYADYYHEGREGFEWRDNETFSAFLKFERFARGRSKAGALLTQHGTGTTYYMFLSDFEKELQEGRLTLGSVLAGQWQFVKRGSNYAIQRVA